MNFFYLFYGIGKQLTNERAKKTTIKFNGLFRLDRCLGVFWIRNQKTNQQCRKWQKKSTHTNKILGADKLADSWKLKRFQIVYILIVWQKCLGVNCHSHSMYTDFKWFEWQASYMFSLFFCLYFMRFES